MEFFLSVTASSMSKQHGGHTILIVIVIVIVVVVALAAPTPAEQSPYHSSLFPIKMSAKSQESHGTESLAGLDHSRGPVHREA